MTKQVKKVNHTYDKKNICKKCGQSKKANLHFKWDCRPIVKKVKSVKAWALVFKNVKDIAPSKWGKIYSLETKRPKLHCVGLFKVVRVLITEVK